jgi:beta-D-xylosidase 4
LLIRFRAGLFDPKDSQIYTTYGLSDIASPAHHQANYEGALQSFVLLHNDGNAVLPLSPHQKVALVGPKATSQETLLEQYYGDQVCFGGGYACMTTIAQAMQSLGNVTVSQGCNVSGSYAGGIPAALAAARASDVVVLALGLDRQVEGETLDRTTTDLPAIQVSLATQILALNKPTVIFFINGGMISFDSLVNTSRGLKNLALVEAFYPGFEGATALARTLYGLENRWGKLPVTIYSSSFQHEQNMLSFDMTTAPGRTYRYYVGQPLYPFGWGLSYSSFGYQCHQPAGDKWSVVCDVSIVSGQSVADEVVLLFHRVSDGIREAHADHPFPIKNLVDFQRVRVDQAAGPTRVTFTLSEENFRSTNAHGSRVVYMGCHYVDVGLAPHFTATFNL